MFQLHVIIWERKVSEEEKNSNSAINGFISPEMMMQKVEEEYLQCVMSRASQVMSKMFNGAEYQDSWLQQFTAR